MKSRKNAATKTQSHLQGPAELQQPILNIFRDTLLTASLTANLKSLLQEIKGHLYNRDFKAAFGRPEYLEAYAARWSPTRALGYLDIFRDIWHHVRAASDTENGNCSDETGNDGSGKVFRITCLGGGAGAELVAFGALVRLLERRSQSSPDDGEEGISIDLETQTVPLHIKLIDIAPWAHVIDSLLSGITNPPILSPYASAAARASNRSLAASSVFNAEFLQHDLLAVDANTLASLLEGSHLVTCMFTLNELYKSVPQTQRLLLDLTKCLSAGSILLVVDSPGSFSTVTINGVEKKYPMHWLLDHALLRGQTPARWEKLVTEESRWFRLPDGLKYPIELENMRYQMHLYRKI